MKRTLILTGSEPPANDPLFQALAAVLGPAQAASASNDLPSANDIVRVVGYTPNQGSQLAVLHLLEHTPRPCGRELSGWVGAPLAPRESMPVLNLSTLPDPSTTLDAVLTFAMQLRQHATNTSEAVKEAVEDFLRSHNTCALSTTYRGEISSRPIEYHYLDGEMHFISEGGEKFAGLLANHRAAVSVFDSYQGFANLAGMQLTGSASVPPIDSPEYERSLCASGLKRSALARLPVQMHAVILHLEQALFTWSGFTRQGLEPRQVYRWK